MICPSCKGHIETLHFQESEKGYSVYVCQITGDAVLITATLINPEDILNDVKKLKCSE